MNTTHKKIITIIAILLFVSACNMPGFRSMYTGGGEQQSFSAAEGGTLMLTAGGKLEVPEDALSQDAIVSVTVVGDGTPLPPEDPFEPIGQEVEIDLGEVGLNRQLVMSLPVEEGLAEEGMIFVARTYSPDGVPMLVGATYADGLATFPIVGSGFYQLLGILPIAPETFPSQPLHVPSYPQIASCWCSPTALTDLAQFHEGVWPAGDWPPDNHSSIWGESSNWYLAGLNHQAHDSGSFFQWVLMSGGFTSLPESVWENFSNEHLQVITWNWEAAIWGFDSVTLTDYFVDPEIVGSLYDAFHAYAESFVWGVNGSRRPIAWGSGREEHSRVITGSDGTVLYYNETGNGLPNQIRTWAQDRQAVIDAVGTTAGILDITEYNAIGTVVFFAEPRPETERRGVIWLRPYRDATNPGAIVFRQGVAHEDTCYWHWDGSDPHSFGYYFADAGGSTGCSSMATHTELEHAFEASSENDLQLWFHVFNISEENYDYTLAVELIPEMGLSELVLHEEISVFASSLSSAIEGTVPLDDIQQGLHTLRFTLWQNGEVQDVKYVSFAVSMIVAPPPPPPPPMESVSCPLDSDGCTADEDCWDVPGQADDWVCRECNCYPPCNFNGTCEPEYGEQVGNCSEDCAVCGDGIFSPLGGEICDTSAGAVCGIGFRCNAECQCEPDPDYVPCQPCEADANCSSYCEGGTCEDNCCVCP